MPQMRRVTAVECALLCLLTVPFACQALRRLALPPLPRLSRPIRPAAPVGWSETALAEAGQWRQRAVAEVQRRREELEEWDPAAVDPGIRESPAHEPWRLQQLAADPCGYLRRAEAEATRAAKRAQTPRLRYRATLLLASIEHELDQPDQELQQARRLVALQPRNDLSLLTLRRATICCGRPSLAAQIDRRLANRRKL
jgi:hypothetical protein